MGAISKCKFSKGQFVSSYFLRPKADGSARFILNLKSLNKYFQPPHFKLEDYRTALKLTYPNCFYTLIDLKDAYFSIAIHWRYRKYFRFLFNDHLWEFNSLPFGFSPAPFIFTKIMKPVLHSLRINNITCVCYLDDLLIISPTITKSINDTRRSVLLLEKLGFTINVGKSQLDPNNLCIFLGFVFNSKNMTLSLPLEKSQRISKLITELLMVGVCSVRHFARIIGSLVAACPAIKYGWLYLKSLEREKYKAIKNGKSYNHDIRLTDQIRSDLEWWLRELIHTVPISKRNYNLTIFSDASTRGWGGFCNNIKIHGFWTKSELKNHINWLEMMAAFNSLRSFTKDMTNLNILLRLDNITAISLINKMGSVKYTKLNSLTRQIWLYCERKRIFIFASYITSKNNVEADAESRFKNIDTEYELNKFCFHRICLNFGTPEIDLFATYRNTKCAKFVSWKPDPYSTNVDSFTIRWSDQYFYAFPPFALILRMLNKIVADRAEGIVVVPWWPSQPWFPLFKKLVMGKTLLFKPSKHLILSPFRNPHPLWKSTTLVAARLSGKRF